MKATIIIMLVLVAGGVQPVFAYSIDGGSSAVPISTAKPGFQNLFSPFENFINSINSVGTPAAIRIGIPPQGILPPAIPSAIQAGAQNMSQRFDEWLYGIVGFHIGGLLAAILGIFSWILGAVKGVVDWLLGLFR